MPGRFFVFSLYIESIFQHFLVRHSADVFSVNSGMIVTHTLVSGDTGYGKNCSL